MAGIRGAASIIVISGKYHITPDPYPGDNNIDPGSAPPKVLKLTFKKKHEKTK